MIGPPAPARRCWPSAVPTILPPLTFEEAIETTKIHSVAGLLDQGRPGRDSAPSARRTIRFPMRGLSAAASCRAPARSA